jgi:hypothetical protein
LIRVHPWLKLKTPCTPAQLRKRIKDRRIVGKQGDGVSDSRAQPVQPRTGELQFDVIAGGNL